MASISKAPLRVARPTNNIDTLLDLYGNGLKLQKVGEFGDHQGFDGIILGHAGCGYHLEFTKNDGHDAGRAPTRENLLIFYLPFKSDYDDTVANMEKVVGPAVQSLNPYWDDCGKTFEDPDSYRIVLAHMEWKA